MRCEEFRELTTRLATVGGGSNAEIAAVVNHGQTCEACALWIVEQRKHERPLTREQAELIDHRLREVYSDPEASRTITDSPNQACVEQLEKSDALRKLDQAIVKASESIGDCPAEPVPLIACVIESQLAILEGIRELIARTERSQR